MQTGFLGVGSATRARRAPLSSSPGSSRRLTVSLSLNSTRVGCAAACACVRACVRACKVILDFLRFGHLLSFPVRSLLTWSAHETGRGRYDGRRSAELQHFCGLRSQRRAGLCEPMHRTLLAWNKRWCTTQKQEDHVVAWAIEIEPSPGLMNKSPCLQRQMQRPLGGLFPGPGAFRRKELKFCWRN